MKWIVGVALLLVAAGLGYLAYIASQIQKESTVDEEHTADAIVVLGAAEYRGRPSPVLEALRASGSRDCRCRPRRS